MTDRAAAVSLFLAVTLVLLMFAPRTFLATPRSQPIPITASDWTPLGAPLGTSRIIPTADPPDWEPLEAGAERRSPAGGAPQSTEASPEPEAGLETPHSGAGGASDTQGVASWYRDPRHPAGALYAAVPAYRWGMARWMVKVCTATACVSVRVSDHCQCYVGTANERVIDLSPTAFGSLAPLSKGLVKVTVRR